MNDMKAIFENIFEDSARLVMMILQGSRGIEFQIYDRDENTTMPIHAFLSTQDNLERFLESCKVGRPGILYIPGATPADLQHSLLTGERLPGVRENFAGDA